MANKKITELVAATTMVDADVVPVVTDIATSAATKKITFANFKASVLASPTLTGTTTAGPINVTGTVAATTLTGAGSGITALNATNLASGTVPDARFPATLPAASGANLTALNATNLASGTVPDARFPATLAQSFGVARASGTAGTVAFTATRSGGGSGWCIDLVGDATTVGQYPFRFDSRQVETGSGAPAALGNKPGAAGTVWRWVPVTVGSTLGYIPVLTS